VLILVDNFNCQCIATRLRQSFKGMDVVRIMNDVKQYLAVTPERIQVGKGSEFINKDFDKWAYENNITSVFSRPGKPTDNPYIESFNGSLQDKCLNVNGSCHWKIQRRKLRSGDMNTIITDHIVL
jgi:putative transposase